MEVKFKSDDIPDSLEIYIIRNKKYVCEKIEMEIKGRCHWSQFTRDIFICYHNIYNKVGTNELSNLIIL